jgi:hypothetical protein
MGPLTLVRVLARIIKPEDFIAFMISAVLGLFAASLLPQGPWAIYTFLLVYYHLFLAWMVIDADRRKGSFRPAVQAILIHLVFLTLVVTLGVERNVVPFFGLCRCCVIVLAVFERNWLFSGFRKMVEVPVLAPVSAEAASVIASATADDYDAWLQYLAQRDPLTRKPGVSIQNEYEQWMVARAKSRSAASTNESPA